MKSFIWDLDGTLLDSYGVIVSSILQVCRSLQLEREEVHKQIIRHSVTCYLESVADVHGFSFREMKESFDAIGARHKGEIGAIPHAKEAMDALKRQGAGHFVYTHRGETSNAILQQIGLGGYFDEIVTSLNGFPRKPEPDGVLYLVRKYGLDPMTTFYVGDRTIDMDCAKNAGIKGILFLPEGSFCEPNGSEDHIVHDLMEITGI